MTGGAGYIGSHTLLELIREGQFDVISADNFSNSEPGMLTRLADAAGQAVKNYNIDLTRKADTQKIFTENPGIVAVIHFAALKSVPESVEKPELYFKNNCGSLEVILECMQEAGVNCLIFSSSCSVYGNAQNQPVDENTVLEKAESPYGASKQEGERILAAFCASHPSFKAVALRYFNPVGADKGGKIGEVQKRYLTNLVPYMCSVASGERKELLIHGSDYPTRDGTCIRDYIHVSDIARAHLMSFRWINEKDRGAGMHIFNLGSGKGTTVQEAVDVFQKVNRLQLNYRKAERRAGDVAVIYSKAEKAGRELGWKPELSVEEMMRTAWEWEKKYRSQS